MSQQVRQIVFDSTYQGDFKGEIRVLEVDGSPWLEVRTANGEIYMAKQIILQPEPEDQGITDAMLFNGQFLP